MPKSLQEPFSHLEMTQHRHCAEISKISIKKILVAIIWPQKPSYFHVLYKKIIVYKMMEYLNEAEETY